MTGIFKQNLTSDLIFEVLCDLKMSPAQKFLDLGCGDGNIGLRVAEFHKLDHIFGSDVSDVAVAKANKNAREKNISVDYRIGSQLDPWLGEKFDFISCDVAAISSVIADISEWYKGVSCLTGEDGLVLVEPIIKNIKNFLEPGGIFVIPKISLANETRLQAILEETFTTVVEKKTKNWPVPKKVIDELIANDLGLNNSNWKIKEIFGLHTASTAILKCSD